MNLNNLKLNGRTIAIGLLVIVGIFIIGSQLLGGGNSNDNDPVVGDNSSETSEIQIGQVVSASALDADECPVDSVSTFDRSDPVYVVATDSTVPSGTDVFARLSRDGTPIEDSVLITADRDYVDTCIYFVFEATSGAEVLDTGDYSAEMIINGNPGPSVDFQVR